jgi:hypothetical protein
LVAGTAEITVQDDLGSYIPGSTNAKFGSTGLHIGQDIQVSILYQTTTYAAFRGYIDSITPQLDIAGRQTALLHCVDAFGGRLNHGKVDYLSNASSSGNTTQIDARTAASIGTTGGIIATILDLWGWPDTRHQITETGRTLNTWYVYQETPMQQFNKLLTYEGPGSMMFCNSSGSVTFFSSTHRATSVVTTTYSNNIHAWDYAFSLRNLINVAEVTVHPTGAINNTTSVNGTVLGSVRNRDYGSQSSGSTLYLTIPLSTPVLTAVIPVGGDSSAYHFAIVSDVDGTTNVPGGVTTTGQLIGNSALSLRIVSQSTDAWHLQTPNPLKAGFSDTNTTVYVYGQQSLDASNKSTYSDSDSTTKYGTRLYEADLPYSQSTALGSTLADLIVNRYKAPLPDYSRMAYIGNDTVSTPDVLTRELGDRIRVTVSRLGITGTTYFITAGEWALNPDGATVNVTWSLEKA